MAIGGSSSVTAIVVLLLLWIAARDAVVAEWDYIVVGAGASGCALASQLANDASKSVLIIEAGGPMGWDLGGREQRDVYSSFGGNSNVTVFDVPGETMKVMVEGPAARPEFWWETVPWGLQGKGVGGSGGLNFAIAFPGSPEDFKTWPEGWSYEEMEPFYKRVLEAANVGQITSADGELYMHATGNALDAVLKNQLGFKEAPLNGSPVRVNTSSLTEHSSEGGQRFDSCRAFLLPALRTKQNLRLEINSPVKRITFSMPGYASGVELENGGVFRLNEGGKVVATAGPFNTPKLLMYSGIGPPSELERLDKHGLVHNPRDFWIFNQEMGAQMHDHIFSAIMLQIPDAMEDVKYHIDFDDPQTIADYMTSRSGPLAQYLVPRIGFLAMPGRTLPDFELGALSIRAPGVDCSNCTQFFMFSLAPTARSAVKINTPDLGCSCGGRVCSLGDFCVPDLYCTNDKDLDDAVWAMSTFIEAMENEGLTVMIPPSKDPALLRKWFVSPENFRASWHFAGSCSLGRCTDNDLKVKGTQNVYVADTSIFPDPLRAHNVLTTIAVGHKAAHHVSKQQEGRASPTWGTCDGGEVVW